MGDGLPCLTVGTTIHTENSTHLTTVRPALDIPDESQWSRGEDPAYLYYCDNETVVGVEFPDVPDAKGEGGDERM